MALTEVDRELIHRCLSREPSAWREFVDRFLPLFAHVIQHSANARSVPLQQSDIEDLTSEVLVTIADKDFAVLRRFRGHSSLATYLVVIARRVVVREMIHRRMSEAFGHVRSNGATAHAGSPGMAETAAPMEVRRFEMNDVLQSLLQQLPQRDALVMQQYHILGKSYKEISQLLNIPMNSIGPILLRAMNRLRILAPTLS